MGEDGIQCHYIVHRAKERQSHDTECGTRYGNKVAVTGKAGKRKTVFYLCKPSFTHVL